MSLAVVHSRALDGLRAPEVTVEVHLANGLPSFTLVGLADTEVKESRERVRAALQTSGLDFPANKRITVNLAPAELPKESGRFDLPIALGILAASGQIDAARLARPSSSPASCRWPATCGRCAARWRWRWPLQREPAETPRAWCCRPKAPRRRRWSAASPILAATHLLEVVRALLPGEAARGRCRAAAADAAVPAPALPDLRDVKGQAGAKRALEIAAAGGHSLLMVGPPGTGKSMLAQRFAGLLPALTHDEALESAARAQPDRRASCRDGWGRARAALAAPQRLVGGAGRRRLAAAAGRDLAGAPRRAVPRRAARVPRAQRSRRCASRSRPAASRSRARRGRPTSRPASSCSPR